MRLLLALVLGLAVSLTAQEIRLRQIASGVVSPSDIQSANDGSERMFFVQQNGLIRIYRNGQLIARPFLDITAKTRASGERGLLGLAFPPGFAQSQRFYVDYTDLNGDTVIAQYRVTPDRDVADSTSEIVLLKITQPFANHNGGQVRFGPDGYLYIGMGDGGSGGDPFGNGQNRGALLGKLLRIDVETEPGHIRIPPDNPFLNTGGTRPEIWDLGLRNPWRFSFDTATGDLWIADVGQNNYEEINFEPAGSKGAINYGWNVMEGAHCFEGNCNTQGLVQPIAEYTHGEGCSVTGGFVYRGNTFPGLRGIYLYGDYCSGRIWGIERQGSAWVNRLLLASGLSISTFGQDDSGEIYVADAANGVIHQIEGSSAPRFTAASVVNAASFVPGLTAGSLQTLFASGVLDRPGILSAAGTPLATSLNGVSITVAGTPAPIHLIANRNGQEQINFQAPSEIRGLATASVVVTRNGQSSAPVNVPELELQPAIYTAPAGGAVVVHNSDYTLVTPALPLVPGESAFLYAAGLGAVVNQPATGSAAPASPLAETVADVRVTLAGLACEVQYAGLAPGLVGVYQVNFRVPINAPGGPADLMIMAGDASSPVVKTTVR
jgi:uncharacterized protein (TIGR03437 family)